MLELFIADSATSTLRVYRSKPGAAEMCRVINAIVDLPLCEPIPHGNGWIIVPAGTAGRLATAASAGRPAATGGD